MSRMENGAGGRGACPQHGDVSLCDRPGIVWAAAGPWGEASGPRGTCPSGLEPTARGPPGARASEMSQMAGQPGTGAPVPVRHALE